MSEIGSASSLSYVVRKASAREAGAIAAIHQEAREQAYSSVLSMDQLTALSLSEREKYWKEQILLAEANDLIVLVAERGEDVVGFICVKAHRKQNNAEVDRIYVAPAEQRKGVGKTLLAEGLNYLRDYGFEKAVLWVYQDSAPGRQFCQESGFRPDGAARKNHSFPMELRYATTLEAY